MSDVCSVDLEVYGAPDLRYDFGLADAVATTAQTAAAALENQIGSRASYVTTAGDDFKGRFSELFAANAATAANDSRELGGRLRDVVTFMGKLSDAAREENARRRHAREWRARVEERRANWLDATWDNIFGEEPPPTTGTVTAPTFNASAPAVSPRDTPGPGGGYGSGTSSARPENLRSFATGNAGLDAALASYPGRLSGAAADFMATCDFGGIDVGPVASGFTAWLSANANDTSWASTIAAAFEDAGAGSGITTVSDAALEASLAAAGVGASRQDLAIDAPTAWGGALTTGFVNDPVNSATGNFLEPENDLPFPDATALLAMTRMYNSLDERGGVFGVGWSSVLDTALQLTDEEARFVQPDGRQIVFGRDGDGWARASGENSWLSRVPGSELVALGLPAHVLPEALLVSDNTGGWWAFGPSGTWVGMGRGAGNTVWAVRDRDGRVTRIEHRRGRAIDIEYAGEQVLSVTASDGRRIEYLYDENRLVGVSGTLGVRTYRWNDGGLIDQVASAAGVIECTNVYDAKRRVREQTTQFGRRTRFTYLSGRVTEVADADGGNANSWIADRKGRLVGIVDTGGNRQSLAYDPHGNLVSVTERDKQVTVHAYDGRGRKTRTVTPEGADITYGYDDHDRVTTVVTAAGGVVTYEYPNDIERNPSRITDPVGGVTQMQWDQGLLAQVVDPEGVVLAFEYNAHGELVGTRNADGAIARPNRDRAGRIVEAVTPTGNRTRYRYDDAGSLASREDPDGSVWRYEHGAGGVITATIDPYGARTEYEYGSHGGLTRTIDPLGRAVERAFDEYGNVAGVTLPDGAAWSFTHDSLSRLTEITDPAGGSWARRYDVNGQLAVATDPTGVHTEISRSRSAGIRTIRTAFEESSIHYDRYGRPEKVEDTGGDASLITYDACGRPVEILDGDGGLTQIRRDLAGRVTAVTSPAGRVTRYEYDRCGRPVTAVDAQGGRTTLTYDLDSRVIARTLPTGESGEVLYDAVGRVIRERAPGAGVARYGYDKAGRLVFSQDSRFGQRRFGYDAAGQLLTATNGLGGVTRYEYDQRGRMVRITDPLGGVTTRTYTELDKVDAQTDPIGRVTTATYDKAGRQVSQTDPDGNTTVWSFDEVGLESGLTVNGRLVTEIRRDARTRTATIIDRTRDGAEITHTLRFNRLGRLVERTSADRTMRWEYDADGARTGMVTPDGVTVRYTHDPVGNVTRIDHSELGEVAYARDAFGRILEARAGDLTQTWDYRDGYPVQHTRADQSGVSVTRIDRDESGRIIRVDGPDGVTEYQHDDACELTSAVTNGEEATWTYDQAGRLVQESGTTGTRAYAYDAAGQLQNVVATDGEVTEYAYDGQGRRARKTANGIVTEYGWDDRGWLSSITERSLTAAADVLRQTELWVNALGELAEADTLPLTWDTAAYAPEPVSIGGTSLFRGPGALTGINGDWTGGGWRDTRETTLEDPWQALREAGGASVSGALSLTAGGAITLDGLEWMGARAYDPAARGFLSTDPLTAPTGAAWSANPYSFAGNDPLHATDPLGLQPVTDADLKAYANAHQGALATAATAVGEWWDDNWEYVAGGAMVVVGGVMMATGVGGPVGLALIGAGADTIIQKATTGEVNWGQVALSGAFGLVPGAGVAGNLLAHVGANAAEGAVQNVAQYAISGQPLTAGGFLETAASGAAMSAVTGGALKKLPVASAIKKLEDEVPSPNYVDLASADRRTHILDGDATGGGHRWPGADGKSAFPKDWSDDKIMHEISDVTTDPSLKWTQQTGAPGADFTRAGNPTRHTVIGTRHGVDIKVVIEPAGEGIISGYPIL